MKCDAEPPNAWSRCRHKGLECVIACTPASRRPKTQLHKEPYELRRHVRELDTNKAVADRVDQSNIVQEYKETSINQAFNIDDIMVRLTTSITKELSYKADVALQGSDLSKVVQRMEQVIEVGNKMAEETAITRAEDKAFKDGVHQPMMEVKIYMDEEKKFKLSMSGVYIGGFTKN